jgi:molybdopterin molybdotransferase
MEFTMKEFFKVKTIDQALEYVDQFPRTKPERVSLMDSVSRILAENIQSDIDLPDFPRSIMDGFAVRGSSTFGASEGNPAYLVVKGTVAMGDKPNISVGPGEAVRISTGGMLPADADSVVMIEHTEKMDDTTIEVYRSVAPGQNLIEVGEDIKQGEMILESGRKIRSQESGMLAALGIKGFWYTKNPLSASSPPVMRSLVSGKHQGLAKFGTLTPTPYRE